MSKNKVLAGMANYDERYNSEDGYTRLAFLPNAALQAAELNDLQAQLQDNSARVLSPLYKEGSLLKGGNISIKDGVITLEAADVYVKANAIKVAASVLTLPDTVDSVVLGVRVTSSLVTALQDPSLRDPSQGTANYSEPGAARLKQEGKFAFSSDPLGDYDEFYPIWNFSNGALVTNTAVDTTVQSFNDALARYDVQANGSYVSQGMTVSYAGASADSANHLFTLQEGVANVDGYQLNQQYSRKFSIPTTLEFSATLSEPLTFKKALPAIQFVTITTLPVAKATVSLTVNGTPYNYTASNSPTAVEVFNGMVAAINGDSKAVVTAFYNSSSSRLELTAVNTETVLSVPSTANFNSLLGQANVSKYYSLRKNSIRDVSRVMGIVEVTQTVTHGNYQGAADLLSNTPVVQVVSVKQGSTVFSAGVDFVVDGDAISWSPAGAEPASSSSYTVTYRYQTTLSVTVNDTRNKILVQGFADNTLFYVDYTYYLGRIDRVMVSKDNTIDILKGASDYYSPQPSRQPSRGLSIALVTFRYGSAPTITMDFVQAFKMSDIKAISDTVKAVQYNIAQLSLKDTVKGTDPTTNKINTFVDSFANENLRDMGVQQNAIMTGQTLMPSIVWEVDNVATSNTPYVLPSSDVLVINQDKQTGSRQINAFMNTEIAAKDVTVSPSSYRWIASSAAYSTWSGWGNRVAVWYTQSWLDDDNTTYPLPQISLTVFGAGFNYNEQVQVLFDDMLVTTVSSDNTGKVKALFTTPKSATSGNKKVVLQGTDSGAKGVTTFTAQPQRSVYHQHLYYYWGDPIAEVFTCGRTGFYSKLEVMFAVAPTTPVTVLITGSTAGVPDRGKALARKVFAPSDITLNGWFEVNFEQMVRLEENVDYAIVIQSSDAIGQVKIARLGAMDTVHGKWVTSQPLPSGVLLNSSSGVTWSPIQEEDLTFRLYAKSFVANDAQVLGVVDVSNVSDLMLLAGVELFPKTFIQFTAVLLDRGNETYVISPYVPLTIEAYTGRVQIAYVMSSQDNAVSPLIEGSIQLASGLVSLTSNYAARSFAVNGSNLRVYLDILETTEAKVHVYAKNAAGVVVELTRNAANSTPLDNNWVRMPFELTGQVGWTNTSISIALVTSHVTARAYAMNLMSYIY